MLAYHKQIHVDKRTTMKNQNRKAVLGRPAMKLHGEGGFNFFAVDQPSPLVLHLFLRHLVVWFAWKSFPVGRRIDGETWTRSYDLPATFCTITESLLTLVEELWNDISSFRYIIFFQIQQQNYDSKCKLSQSKSASSSDLLNLSTNAERVQKATVPKSAKFASLLKPLLFENALITLFAYCNCFVLTISRQKFNIYALFVCCFMRKYCLYDLINQSFIFGA